VLTHFGVLVILVSVGQRLIQDTSIRNRIQVMEERISGAEDTIENIETTTKENAKCS
jgi:hypothetical protein